MALDKYESRPAHTALNDFMQYHRLILFCVSLRINKREIFRFAACILQKQSSLLLFCNKLSPNHILSSLDFRFKLYEISGYLKKIPL